MNTSPYSGNGKPETEKSPERLQREIDQTRERIEEKLDTLSYRLSPGEMVDQALSMARQHGGEFGHNLGAQVKNNPLPLLLTTVGLSWLMASSKEPPRYAYAAQPGMGAQGKAGEAMQGAADRARHAKDAVQGKMHQASESMHEASSSMHEGMSHARDRMHESAYAVQGRLQGWGQELESFFYREPVLAGSLGIALGAALGAMLPETEMEDRVMGPASDEAKEKAKSAAAEQYEKGRETAREVAQEAKEKAQENERDSSVPGQSSGYQSGTRPGSSSGPLHH